jgi:hypothetical protein
VVYTFPLQSWQSLAATVWVESFIRSVLPGLSSGYVTHPLEPPINIKGRSGHQISNARTSSTLLSRPPPMPTSTNPRESAFASLHSRWRSGVPELISASSPQSSTEEPQWAMTLHNYLQTVKKHNSLSWKDNVVGPQHSPTWTSICYSAPPIGSLISSAPYLLMHLQLMTKRWGRLLQRPNKLRAILPPELLWTRC